MKNARKHSELSKTQLLELIASKDNEISALKNQLMAAQNANSVDNHTEFFSLKEIIQLMPGNVFWKDKNGLYAGCNNNLAKFQGFESPEEFVGKCNRDFLPKEYADALDAIDQEIMLSNTGRFVEEIGLDANQNPAIFYTQKIPLHNTSGNVVGLLGISMDITERKKIEKELEIAKEIAETSNRAKSQFLAVINHELRTPLTGIIGLIQLLKQDSLSNEERVCFISDLENCSHYLLTLVNDVLDFARMEAGQTLVQIEPVFIEELINEIFSILAILAKNKGLTLRKYIAPNVPKAILADSRYLHQMLINIINNAIKFTNKGYISIEVNCNRQNEHRVQLAIIIKDTGLGIPADKFDAIFEPFKQLENAYNRQSSRSGTGLGLTIVKKLAELLNIKIKIESELNQGSVFTLLGEFDTANEAKIPSSLTSETLFDAKQLKVLLIEDDHIVQLVHKKMLEQSGCSVEIAANGQEALRMFNNQNILFVDIGLPDISGFEIIKTIRNKDKNGIPIIALTGFTGDEEYQACLKAGANEVISKPILFDDLQKLLIQYSS